MKIGKKFNTLTVKEYFFYIDHYRKYTDFNTLGLYRSILENEKLGIDHKLQVRDYADKTFRKSFDFLQLKDPMTFIEISTLGQDLTKADEAQLWSDVRKSQQKILSNKQLKHRNFGNYAKHNCGYDTCSLNGLMIKQGSFLAEDHMHFDTDKNRYQSKIESDNRKADRKGVQRIISNDLTQDQL